MSGAKARNPFQKSPFQTDDAPFRQTRNAFGGFGDGDRVALNLPMNDSLQTRPTVKPPGRPTYNPPPQIAKALDNPFAKMGLELSKAHLTSFVNSAQSSYKGLLFNDSTRAYFSVDQEVVLRKMAQAVLPFSFESQESDQSAQVYRPELYLPLMSLVSFVMFGALKGFFAGRPVEPVAVVNAVVGCLFLSLFEAFLTKATLLFGAGAGLPFFGLLSVAGFKYCA